MAWAAPISNRIPFHVSINEKIFSIQRTCFWHWAMIKSFCFYYISFLLLLSLLLDGLSYYYSNERQSNWIDLYPDEKSIRMLSRAELNVAKCRFVYKKSMAFMVRSSTNSSLIHLDGLMKKMQENRCIRLVYHTAKFILFK